MTNSIILHIIAKKDWEQAQKEGGYTPPSLANEGFIHCSTIVQTVETANLFYKGQKDLLILSISTHFLESPLVYEAPAGMPEDENRVGKFPHIYGHLNLNAVIKVTPFSPNEDGKFELPTGMDEGN